VIPEPFWRECKDLVVREECVRASGKLSPQKRIFMKDYYNFPDDQCIGQ
jgi:hypothetical protein